MSSRPMTDPYATIAKPVDPYESIAITLPPPKPGMIQTLKNNFNAGTQGAKPGDGIIKGAVENFGAGGGDVIRSLGHAVMHPIDTASAAMDAQNTQAAKPLGQQLKDLVTSGAILGPGGTSAVDTAKGLIHAPMRTLGSLGTGAILGEGAGRALGVAADAGSNIRNAAIGDPNAAALRGLQIGPKSDAQLSTLKSVERSRPYLSGATSQADMQARLKPAMEEVWNPYKSSVDAIGNRQIQGPDGMTTVRELEAERQRLSALNRGVKSGNPSDIQQAIQEGRTPAQLIEREAQVQSLLDPHLESTGIKPAATRGTYGALADVRGRVEGKTTLNEKPQPSGFGRMLSMKLDKPSTIIGEPAQGMRDIIAGRPMWSAKPTDLGIREGFATGGPKPDLGTLQSPNLASHRPVGLPAPAIQLGRSPMPQGTPVGYRPPPIAADTIPMRTGKLLNAPPIQLGGTVEGPKGQAFRYDTTAMRQGRILPPSTADDIPLSSHADIFPNQIPSSTKIKPIKVIEGKK